MVAADALPVTLRRVDPAANMWRQYTVAVSPELFDAHVVTCRWGRIGAAGQRRCHVCKSAQEAQNLATDFVAKRRRRGYEVLPKTGVVPALLLRASNAAPVAAPRRRRPALSPRRAWAERHQLWLPGLDRPLTSTENPLNHAASKLPVALPPAKVGAPVAAALPSQATALVMRQLGKPATVAEREAAKARLLADAEKRGLALQCGALPPRLPFMSAHEREMEIQRIMGSPLTGAMLSRAPHASRARPGATRLRDAEPPPVIEDGPVARFAASIGKNLGADGRPGKKTQGFGAPLPASAPPSSAGSRPWR